MWRLLSTEQWVQVVMDLICIFMIFVATPGMMIYSFWKASTTDLYFIVRNGKGVFYEVPKKRKGE